VALPFISSAVIRMVSERVLSNVVEQLPRIMGEAQNKKSPSVGDRVSTDRLDVVETENRKILAKLDRLEQRTSELEQKPQVSRTFVCVIAAFISAFSAIIVLAFIRFF